MGKNKKKPGHYLAPSPQKLPRAQEIVAPYGKSPRLAVSPESFDRDRISWGVKLIEKDGPWGWESIRREALWNEILKKLGEFETMTWGELKGRNNHSIQVSALSKKARDRLATIEQDDIDALFSLRVSGRERVFGIQEGRVLKLLWWDPEHEVCPSLKKHT